MLKSPMVGVLERPCDGLEGQGVEVGVFKQLTPMAENNVIPIEPKYAAVKGSRGSERRCLMYTTGPIRTAHDAKNSTEPIDHLQGWDQVRWTDSDIDVEASEEVKRGNASKRCAQAVARLQASESSSLMTPFDRKWCEARAKSGAHNDYALLQRPSSSALARVGEQEQGIRTGWRTCAA